MIISDSLKKKQIILTENGFEIEKELTEKASDKIFDLAKNKIKEMTEGFEISDLIGCFKLRRDLLEFFEVDYEFNIVLSKKFFNEFRSEIENILKDM